MDVPIITSIQPAPAIGQPTGAQGVTTQNANIITQLPVGSVLSGFVVNRDGAGNPILRTETGDVVFSTNFFLKIGSEIVIRMLNTAGHQNAHIVSVDGLPPEIAETQSGFVEAPETVAGQKSQTSLPQTTSNTTQTRSAASITLPAVGSTLPAIVITPAAGANLSPGSSLLLSVLNPNNLNQTHNAQPASPLSQLIPSAPETSPAANALASLLPEIAPAATPAAPPTAQPFLPNAPVANSLPLTQSNQQAASAQISGALGQTIAATAIATSNDGSVTFDSAIGTLRIASLGPLPQGEQLSLRVTSITSPISSTVQLAQNAAPAPLSPLTQLSKTWPSLQQIVQLLTPEQTNNLIANFIAGEPQAQISPENNARAGSQILFFVAALKGGSFKDWLGSGTVKSLQDKGYSPLINKAEGEFKQIAQQFLAPQPGNWQSAFIPVVAAGELTQLRAYIKREKKKDEQGKPTGDEDTRFVLEMDLSQLGEMQMDGLVKRRENGLQFDLIVRSAHPLPTELEQDISAIYASTAELTGYHGQIAFQAAPTFPVHPLEDTTPHVFDDVVV